MVSEFRIYYYLMTVLLEYIDCLLLLLHKCRNIATNPFYMINFISYYAGIMLNAFCELLCSKLCCHNRWVPTIYAPFY